MELRRRQSPQYPERGFWRALERADNADLARAVMARNGGGMRTILTGSKATNSPIWTSTPDTWMAGIRPRTPSERPMHAVLEKSSPAPKERNLLPMTDAPKPRIPILAFAYSYLGLRLYPWQQKILETYATGNHTAVAASNFSGKTSILFPCCALWTLYCHPTARVMYLSATGAQVDKQFFAALNRFRDRPAFSSWTWLSSEVRTPAGGFLFGRATDTGANIEGIHDQHESPAALLIDEAKTVGDDVLDTFERCHTSFRLFASSTGSASGGFYQIMTSKAHLWRTFRITSDMCPHVDPALIAADRENLKDSVFRIKHSCE